MTKVHLEFGYFKNENVHFFFMCYVLYESINNIKALTVKAQKALDNVLYFKLYMFGYSFFVHFVPCCLLDYYLFSSNTNFKGDLIMQ